MSRAVNHRRRAFSLIELVIVIIIMGVISAIAIPRMMRGAEGADITGLQADLAVLRNAIEMYRYEHQAFPVLATFETQLTTVTQADGSAWTTGPKYGPYLIKVPPLKTGNNKDETAVAAPAAVPPAGEVASAGWLYDAASGSIWANDLNHFDK
ncbi:MAG: prepilin-type N-terminal cleavage/methylation domain-containing protein [Planctomycetota bacterium]|jgi:general secretion pathway protein G